MPVTINGTTGIVTPALVNGTALSFRNKIINGNFDIWQRGASLSSGTSFRFLADRFNNNSIGSTYTASQQLFTNGQTDVPNSPYYYHRTVVSSVSGNGNYCALQQRIESVKTFSNSTATLSFYAKADSNKSISVEFVQSFGTGGSPSSNVEGIGVQKLNITSSWQKFTVTVNIPSISSKTIGTDNNDSLVLVLFFDAGSNYNSRTDSLGQQSGTFDIAQVQLEEGSVATPFENRPIGIELALCQRYYQTLGNITIDSHGQSLGTGTSTPFFSVPLPVKMRATPTIQEVNFTIVAGPSTASLVSGASAGGEVVSYYILRGANSWMIGSNTFSFRLNYTAEL